MREIIYPILLTAYFDASMQTVESVILRDSFADFPMMPHLLIMLIMESFTVNAVLPPDRYTPAPPSALRVSRPLVITVMSLEVVMALTFLALTVRGQAVSRVRPSMLFMMPIIRAEMSLYRVSVLVSGS